MQWRKKSEFDDPTVRRHRNSSAKRVPRDAKGFLDILSSIIPDLERPVDDRISILREIWPELVGEQIAKYSEPGFIKNFALNVFVSESGWIPHLEGSKRISLMRIQEKYPKLKIRKIYFILVSK